MKRRNFSMAAVALLSAALIAYQVGIIQLLSLKREWLLQHSETLLPVLMICCGFAMVTAVEISNSGFASFDSYLLFTGEWQWLRLLINYALFFIPFFLGALALGIVFTKNVAEIGRFYFSNLAGSGAGALLAAVLAWFFFPSELPV